MSRKPYRVHMAAAGNPEQTACGLEVKQHGAASSPWTGTLPLASRPDKITCANCLTKLYETARR